MYLNLKKILLFCLVLLLFTVLILHYKAILKLVYPFVYQDIVFQEAADYDLDPYLIAAIIYTESKFDPQATSDKGARGLMQIMPETGRWIAEMIGDDSFQAVDLYDPKVNIKYGCWYLNWLQDKFKGNLAITLAAYNGGWSNVDQWLQTDKWDGKEENIDKIPFSQTRGYVDKVLKVYHRYQFIYDS
ncbi:lytic transglycosylase domain-containing protein [Halanaerobaculum tunisiense]